MRTRIVVAVVVAAVLLLVGTGAMVLLSQDDSTDVDSGPGGRRPADKVVSTTAPNTAPPQVGSETHLPAGVSADTPADQSAPDEELVTGDQSLTTVPPAPVPPPGAGGTTPTTRAAAPPPPTTAAPPPTSTTAPRPTDPEPEG